MRLKGFPVEDWGPETFAAGGFVNQAHWENLSGPILVAGPTASGKSGLVLALAKDRGEPIVNADSMQLYGGLPLLTARPSSNEQALTPHYLYGIEDPFGPTLSVAHWVERLGDVVMGLQKTSCPPQRIWIVGGTGFYLAALYRGLSSMPSLDPTAKAQLRLEYGQLPLDQLRALVKEQDPHLRPMPVDPQRLCQALIVRRLTGRPLSWWHQRPRRPVLENPTLVVLDADMATLQVRAGRRWQAMCQAGVIQEVAAFCAHPNWRQSPLVRAIGFQEIVAYLEGGLSFQQLSHQYLVQTRRYIKRQRTWLRHQFPACLRVQVQGSTSA